jgi:predicted DNA-binding WGR domain protein
MRFGSCWKSISNHRRYDYQQNRISAKYQIRNVASFYLERREPARNIQRFYAITVTRTLFDGWAVMREWGRIGQPGTVRETGFATEGEACAAGERWRQRKVKRGYRAVGG